MPDEPAGGPGASFTFLRPKGTLQLLARLASRVRAVYAAAGAESKPLEDTPVAVGDEGSASGLVMGDCDCRMG